MAKELGVSLSQSPDADTLLDHQLRSWRSVGDLAETWHVLEPVYREVVQLEWEAITESGLRALQALDAEGALNERQQALLHDILELAHHNRPVLHRLFET